MAKITPKQDFFPIKTKANAIQPRPAHTFGTKAANFKVQRIPEKQAKTEAATQENIQKFSCFMPQENNTSFSLPETFKIRPAFVNFKKSTRQSKTTKTKKNSPICQDFITELVKILVPVTTSVTRLFVPKTDSETKLITPEITRLIPRPAIKGFSFNFATQKEQAKTKIPLHKKVKAKAAYKLPKAIEKKKNKKLERFTRPSKKTAKTPAYSEIKAAKERGKSNARLNIIFYLQN